MVRPLLDVGATPVGLSCCCCILVALFISSALANDPQVEWANEQEECTATSTGIGEARQRKRQIWSYRDSWANGFPSQYLPTNFSRMITDKSQNVVVVGARNAIVTLQPTVIRGFGPKFRVDVVPSDSQIQECRDNGMPEEDCHNHNRVLLRSQTMDHVYLECGTGAVNPTCNWRNFTNGAIVARDTPDASEVCPYLPRPNTALLAENDAVYAGTFSVLNEAMITRSSSGQPTLSTLQDTLWLDSPEFIGSFEHGNHVYMVLTERAQEASSDTKIVSRIVRICKDDQGRNGRFRSFLKMRIVCLNGDSGRFSFDQVTAIHVAKEAGPDQDGNELNLYATFHLPDGAPKGSAVCAYRLSDIVRLFDESPFHYRARNNIWIERERDATANTCDKATLGRDSMKYLYLKEQLVSSSIIMLERIGLTSIVVERIGVYDVFFLGTDAGEVLKVARFEDTKSSGNSVGQRKYRVLIIDRMSLHTTRVKQLLKAMAFMLVMTEDDIYPMSLVQCYYSAKTCGACVKVRDPYCGWCVSRSNAENGYCLPYNSCELHIRSAYGPNATVKYVADVAEGDASLCGPVVEVDQPDIRAPVFANSNHSVNLTINVRHAHSIHWQRGLRAELHDLPTGGRFKTHHDKENGKAILEFRPAVSKDRGYYTVRAFNNISNEYATQTLVVLSLAQISGQPKDVEVTVGSAVMFECRLKKRSQQEVEVTWLYCLDNGRDAACNEEAMSEVRLSRSVLMTKENTLIFMQVQPRDVGRYRCQVRRDNVNIKSSVARLDIIDNGRLIEGSAEITIPATTGQGLAAPTSANVSLKLHCASSCNYENEHQLGWHFNGRPLEDVGLGGLKVRQSKVKCRSTIFLHPPVALGTYACHIGAPQGKQKQQQCNTMATANFLASFFIGADQSFTGNEVKVVLHCRRGDSQFRHTIGCPARRSISSSPAPRWLQVPNRDSVGAVELLDKGKQHLHGSETYSFTRSGDLRLTDCASLPPRTVFLCWIDPDEQYVVMVEPVMVP